MRNVFEVSNVVVDDKLTITILEIDSLTEEILGYLDSVLTEICLGSESDWDIETTKLQIADFFKNKKPEWQMGQIAEFFIHVYMKSVGIRQEFIFLNLEERGSKKGFDGFYSDESLHWLMESKSGGSELNSHHGKLNEALKDLGKKVDGKTPNSPWREAYNHASNQDVKSADKIRDYLNSLTKDYLRGLVHERAEFNVIPCATLYFEDNDFQDKLTIESNIKTKISDEKFQRVRAICVSNRSIQTFKDYIGIVDDEL